MQFSCSSLAVAICQPFAQRKVIKMNNAPGRDAVIAVQEERARIGGVEVARKTLIAATDEGLVFEVIANNASLTGSGKGV